jgi:hypothetical protein
MAKRNKNKQLKKRKKRQLKKVLKLAVKQRSAIEPVVNVGFPEWYIPPNQEPPVDTNKQFEERDKAFQSRLDSVYPGTVTALTHYVNDKSTMTCKCKSCGLVFFGKAGHLISDKEHQRHVCNMPYGTVSGERLAYVSTVHKPKGKNQAKKQAELFHQMIWDDYSPQEIAKELQVNTEIIKHYFIEEGLIEEPPKGTFKADDLTLVDTSKFGRKSFKDDKGRLFLECTECKAIKYSDDFLNNKKGFHGKNSKCRTCESKSSKQKRAKC